MTTGTVERSDEWDAVPFAGGLAGLQELATDEFSGKVIAGSTTLFMLRGSVVGILGGAIEDFQGTDGTAREAPHPALPLLAVMQERSDEVRAKYYSEDTPLSEIDQTLEDGNFTGYVELSENVLSGDYYQVYHQGRSMSVAWVGAAERLITDEEAFEQANDEVGIYEVRPVEIEIVDVPEPEGEDAATAGGSAAERPEYSTASTTGTSAGDADAAGPETTGDDATGGSDTPAGADAANREGDADEAEVTGNAGTAGADERDRAGTDTEPAPSKPGRATAGDDDRTESARTPDTGADDPLDSRESGGPGAGQGRRSGADATGSRGQAGGDGAGSRQASGGDPAETGRTQGGHGGGGAPQADTGGDHDGNAGRPDAGRGDMGGESAGGGEFAAADLETRSLPSLDPDRTASASRQARQRTDSTAGAGGQGQRVAEGGTNAHGGRESTDRSAHPGARASEEAAGAQESASGRSDGQPEPAQRADSHQAPPTEGGGQQPDAGRTARADAGESAGGTADTAEVDAADAGTENAQGREQTGEPAEPDAGSSADTRPGEPTGQPEADTVAAVEEQVEEVTELQSELNDLEGERDDLAEQRDRLESELEEARDELERLRGQLNEAVGEAVDAERQLTPAAAIDETNLFVRYDSKGDATLENAHAGDAEKAAVDENLRLEYHTGFDAGGAAVDGQPFDDFLRGTIQYRFGSWLVGELLYEIRDTGHGGAMADLFDGLPRIDRIELNGIVTVSYTQNGEEHRSQEGFDVVARDRMGDPLIVANINDSRDPATDAMMTDLVTAAERVGESNDSLAGAFLVTRSYFEPESLETAAEATSGGLLSRDKHRSFVNLSRKGGYHLCLVEARNQEFHLTVPEL